MLTVSSVVISLDDLLSLGGGDDPFPGGVADLRDLRDLLDPLEGVRYGISCGVGSEAAVGGPPSSSSVSHTAISWAGTIENIGQGTTSTQSPKAQATHSTAIVVAHGMIARLHSRIFLARCTSRGLEQAY